MLTEMASQQGDSMAGPVHIGFIPTVGPYLLPYIIPALRDAFPKLELFLHEAQTHQLVQQLEEGKLDCIILASVKETEHLKEIPLYYEPMVLALSKEHQWADITDVSLESLRGETLLMLEDGHCLRDQAMGYCFAAGADEDKRFKATSLEALRHMVAAGSGMTVLPKLACPKERERDGVVYVDLNNPVPMREITLDYRPGSPLRQRYEKVADIIHKRMTELFPKVD